VSLVIYVLCDQLAACRYATDGEVWVWSDEVLQLESCQVCIDGSDDVILAKKLGLCMYIYYWYLFISLIF